MENNEIIYYIFILYFLFYLAKKCHKILVKRKTISARSWKNFHSSPVIRYNYIMRKVNHLRECWKTLAAIKSFVIFFIPRSPPRFKIYFEKKFFFWNSLLFCQKLSLYWIFIIRSSCRECHARITHCILEQSEWSVTT